MDKFPPFSNGRLILAAKSWWGDTPNKKYSVQGGFQKYYPKDCRYIYDEFVSTLIYCGRVWIFFWSPHF